MPIPLQPLGIENIASWGFSKDYGLALPQFYVDIAYHDITLRFGHFLQHPWDLKKFLQ